MPKPVYIAGRHAVYHALKSGRRCVHELYYLPARREHTHAELLNLAYSRGIAVNAVDRGFFDGKISVATHQGIAALVDEMPWATLEELLLKRDEQGRSRLLILDGVEDPQNLGALLRTALCLGIQGVVWSRQHASPLSAVAVKVAAGAVEYLSLVRVPNLVLCLKNLKKQGFWIYGSIPEAAQSLWDEEFPELAALVIGGEASGMRRLVRETCDVLLNIPCAGPVQSLNASVAGGILMASFCRTQRSV